MVQKIQILRTSTPNQQPAALSPGELAIEMASVPPRLWVGVPTNVDAAGMKMLLPSGGGVTVAETPPAAPGQGDLWYESDTGILWMWFDDGTSTQWVQVNGISAGGGSSVTVADAPPAAPETGDLWWESDTGILWIWFDDGTSGQWVQAAGSSGGTPVDAYTKAESDAKYVELTGDTMSGPLTVNSTIAAVPGPMVIRAAPAGDASLLLQDETANDRGRVYWNRGTNSLVLHNVNAGVGGQLPLVLDAGGKVSAGNGIFGRSGYGGVYVPVINNFYYEVGQMYAVADDTGLGAISFVSDYRIKKDVAPLPAMWDTVKALRPISYTHQDFTPPVEIANGRTAEQGPFVAGDNIERWGFLAHELQETLTPSAATAEKDAANALQSPNPMVVIAALTKALQEAMTRIEALEGAP